MQSRGHSGGLSTRQGIRRVRSWRADLAPGARIRGPAVIGEDETSTVIGVAFDARIDRFGYIELTRREA